MTMNTTTTTTATAIPMAEELLPRLVPTDVVPAAVADNPPSEETSASTSPLNRVLAIDVHDAVQREGKTLYEVHVFLQSTRSRIPVPSVAGLVGSPKPPGDHSKPPDVVVAKPFGAFRQLRDDVYYTAQAGHDGGGSMDYSCAFCAGVVDAVLLDQSQPHRYHEWLKRAPALCQLLQTFLSDLVGRARDPAPGSATRARRLPARCPVQTAVQSLVASFLELQDDHAARSA